MNYIFGLHIIFTSISKTRILFRTFSKWWPFETVNIEYRITNINVYRKCTKDITFLDK